MGTRRKAREVALQALYQDELLQPGDRFSFELFCRHFQVNRKAMPYARTLLLGIREKVGEIDQRIANHADNWRLERMSVVDRNILRLAVFELIYQSDIPASVAINEAVEIAKRFSTDDSGPFINGILDAMVKEDSR